MALEISVEQGQQHTDLVCLLVSRGGVADMKAEEHPANV